MVDLGTTSVLVADDEPSTRAMVASHLRSIGYKVVEAVDGDEAFSLALEHLPDLVVLDVMMPGMSGWEVCRRIRETVSLAHTGVVMLTGIGESLNEITSPLYGADAYLDKPFEFAVLDRTIAETLEGRRGLVGRPDGADVEIIQTVGGSDELSEAAAVKPKRTRRRASASSDGASDVPKSQRKRAPQRKSDAGVAQGNGAASASPREFADLKVPAKPKKAHGAEADRAPVKKQRRKKAAAAPVAEAAATHADAVVVKQAKPKRAKATKAPAKKATKAAAKPAKKASAKPAKKAAQPPAAAAKKATKSKKSTTAKKPAPGAKSAKRAKPAKKKSKRA